MNWFFFVPFDDLLQLRFDVFVIMKVRQMIGRENQDMRELHIELSNIISHLDDQFTAGDGIASRRGY